MHTSFEKLLDGYFNDQLTANELALLRKMLEAPENQALLKDDIDKRLMDNSLMVYEDKKRRDIIFENIMAAAAAEHRKSRLQIKPAAGKLRIFRSAAVGAAVVIIAFLAISIYVWRGRAGKPADSIAVHKKGEYKNDVMPGGQKATLTLANGTVIDLDAAKNGTLAKQGTANIVKADGRIDYQSAKTGAAEAVYNTIATPKGGQYQLLLPDGSIVWLNAASSIYFPTAFTGNERRVKITGEAYFEVSKDKSKPFIVEALHSEVRVLGTHFNVMAYGDEDQLQTTLVEGSVAFSNNNRTLLLRPLEQSRLLKDGSLDKTEGADIDNILAWKNGMFHFENADIHTIMRQLTRWYNVEVEYRIKPGGDLYFLEMPRNSKLSSVLKVLEISGNIHLEIEGNKIIVS